MKGYRRRIIREPLAGIKSPTKNGPAEDDFALPPLLVVAVDSAGESWPGDDPTLVKWLIDTRRSPDMAVPGPATAAKRKAKQQVAHKVYGKAALDLPPDAQCPLCNGPPGPDGLYSNALAGAGLNFLNGDFRNSFPDMREDRAWQRFGICLACADLLYFYKFHVAENFKDEILGRNTLIIPSVNAEPMASAEFANKYRLAIRGDRRALQEKAILRWLAQNDVPVASITLLWIDFGQQFKNIRGLLTHVLPSRLAQLERDVHDPINNRCDRFYPQNQPARREINLNLGLVAELIRRPGGERVKGENRSPRRFAVMQDLGRCVFHGKPLHDNAPLWYEIEATARSYWIELLGKKNQEVLFACSREAHGSKRRKGPLTLCGWVRHLYLFFDYLRHDCVKVLPKEDAVFVPTEESLRPLFADARGLDNPAKRFAFLLGVIYGHLIYVQAEKAGVNVASNALSWMKSGRLRADELPELFGKITSKLMEYHTLNVGGYHKYERIHALEAELARQGIHEGNHIDPKDLPDDHVLYFLMLGIALSYTFTRTEPKPTGGQT